MVRRFFYWVLSWFRRHPPEEISTITPELITRETLALLEVNLAHLRR